MTAEGKLGGGQEAAGVAPEPFWYKSGVIYEVHVRSFHDGDGDGWGDFAGLTAKLDYLKDLGRFLVRTGTPWHSEHLCFTSVDGSSLHELLPLPFTREAVRHTVARARDLQARLPVPLLLENITYYAELGQAEMDEAAFITEVLEGADVGWLLDVNNVYVNALNFGFDPREWLARMPLDRVAQLHIAGHKRFGTLTVDTHGADVIDPVIELMQWTLARLGRPVPVLLERDNHIPDLEDLLAERARLQAAYDEILAVPVGGNHG